MLPFRAVGELSWLVASLRSFGAEMVDFSEVGEPAIDFPCRSKIMSRVLRDCAGIGAVFADGVFAEVAFGVRVLPDEIARGEFVFGFEAGGRTCNGGGLGALSVVGEEGNELGGKFASMGGVSGGWGNAVFSKDAVVTGSEISRVGLSDGVVDSIATPL